MSEEYRLKLNELKNTIHFTLAPLISGNVHLTNLPYHNNMGDALIWQGSEDFLASTGFKILSRTSFKSFTFPKIAPDDIIVLNGGGSFGDIWRVIMDFFLKVVETYPDNRIILFPQSAFYNDTSLIKHDAEIMGRHPNLYLIARDNYTFNLFSSYFNKNNILLAPDMAFAINLERLKRFDDVQIEDSCLYLKRVDKEWVAETEITIDNATVSDWPTISSPTFPEKLYNFAINKTMYSYPHNSVLDISYWKLLDLSAKHLILNKYLCRASKFLMPYSKIITTRLHVLILACLLNKDIEYIDNSSKKLSAYVNTWLTDFINIKPYEHA